MWTAENRARYNRDHLRYPSDMTNEEWALIEPFIPPAKPGGNKRRVNMREVVNGMMYILSSGCQWRAIPKDFPPRSTIYAYLDLFRYEGVLDRIHHALYMECREMLEREASPTACIIDSQCVKGAEKGGPKLTRTAMMRAKVRLDGAHHRWRKVPSRQLSIDLEADERGNRVTGCVEAS